MQHHPRLGLAGLMHARPPGTLRRLLLPVDGDSYRRSYGTRPRCRLVKMRLGLRNAKVDLILLAGGGAHYFRYHRRGCYQPLPHPRKHGLKTDQRSGAPAPHTYPALYSEHAGAFLVPLASLRSARAPERPLLGLFKSSSGTLGIGDGQHEARFPQRGGQKERAAERLRRTRGASRGPT